MISPVQASIQVTATGYIVPQIVSKVGAHAIGRIARVLVKEGDVVHKGQVLAELDAADQRSAVTAASSRIVVAQSKVETARATLAETHGKVERERAIVSGGAEAKSVLDDLLLQEASLREQVKGAEAEVLASTAERGTLDVTFRERTILAPIDGTIVTKPIKAGEVVSPSSSDPVAEIVDFDSLLAEVDVPEARLSLIKKGGPAEVTLDAYPDRHLRGEVVDIGRRIDRAKATVVVKVKLMDAGEIALPEMSARASFLSKPVSDDALKAQPKKVVPTNAVVERAGRKVVLVLDGDVVRETDVTVGPVMGSSLELLSGPASGTRIVASPPPELSTGTSIKERGT